ncbi:MAG TPA: hypothetical protein DDZ51_02285 [Planctomycetaceae bacterium]|nr:hypothetical protein [Planctomycetaceae bacterium]
MTSAEMNRIEKKQTFLFATTMKLLFLTLYATFLAVCDGGNNNPPPSTSIDLRRWKLTLPVGTDGGKNGKPKEVMPDELAAGFQSEFFSLNDQGAIIFRCPFDGVTTKGTDYPRSELRELLDGKDSSVNWPLQGTHSLRARCRIIQLPSDPKVVIGQIHGYSGTTRPLVKLQYNKDKVEALVKISPASGKDQKLTYPNVSKNDDVHYEIKVDESILHVTVNGVTQSVNVLEYDSRWKDETFYFKAGVYPQTNQGPPGDCVTVEFYELTATHSKPVQSTTDDR